MPGLAPGAMVGQGTCPPKAARRALARGLAQLALAARPVAPGEGCASSRVGVTFLTEKI